MAAPMKTRAERFELFQRLIAEMQRGEAPPATILTRLYNGFTTELSLAEAEMARLRKAADVLREELEPLKKGMSLAVST